MKKITKAIFPVAGMGTRFLPVTKASPKEMLPVVDKPLIQYAVEEAISAGIDEMIFVTSSAKRAIEDHFDRNVELEQLLLEKQKINELNSIKNLLPKNIKLTYIRQTEPLGLGHAVLCAKHVIGDASFAVLLADDLIYHNGLSCMAQMVRAYQEKKVDGVLAIENIPREKTKQYGIVTIDAQHKTLSIIEKPAPEVAPTTLAVTGRYILPATIFSVLENIQPSVGGEIQLTDGIAQLLSSQYFLAVAFAGKRYDCGNKLGYAQANFDYMLRDAETGKAFAAWVEKKLMMEKILAQ